MATIPCSVVEYVHYSHAIEEKKYCVVGAIEVHDSLTHCLFDYRCAGGKKQGKTCKLPCRRSTVRFLAPSRSSGIYVLPLFFYVSFVHPFANTRDI